MRIHTLLVAAVLAATAGSALAAEHPYQTPAPVVPTTDAGTTAAPATTGDDMTQPTTTEAPAPAPEAPAGQ